MADDNTTRDDEKLRARPMSACLDAIYFLSDARRHKDEEIARNPNIDLSFADAGDQQYVSVADTRPDLGDNRKVAL